MVTLDPQNARCPSCGAAAIAQVHYGDKAAGCPHWVPSKGWVTTMTDADRAEAETWEPEPLYYQTGYDQCGIPPFHGNERVALIWSGEPVFICPSCFSNWQGTPNSGAFPILTVAASVTSP
jgi:hypothetical protein